MEVGIDIGVAGKVFGVCANIEVNIGFCIANWAGCPLANPELTTPLVLPLVAPVVSTCVTIAVDVLPIELDTPILTPDTLLEALLTTLTIP